MIPWKQNSIQIFIKALTSFNHVVSANSDLSILLMLTFISASDWKTIRTLPFLLISLCLSWKYYVRYWNSINKNLFSRDFFHSKNLNSPAITCQWINHLIFWQKYFIAITFALLTFFHYLFLNYKRSVLSFFIKC